MSTTISVADVYAAVQRVCRMIDEQEAAFNQLDANTGDGDMGSTLQIVAKAIMAESTPLPADMGQALTRLAMVVAKTSGSSLSAVIMTGLMSLSRSLAGQEATTAADLHAALEAALTAMQTRSRARFGDKTILDGLKAIAIATDAATDFSDFGRKAASASKAALAEFRSKPCRIGRARLSSQGGVGIDDPGMVFLREVLDALAFGR